MTKGGQAFQQGLNAGGAGELAGNLFGGGLAQLVQGVAHGGDLFGQGFGLRGFRGAGGKPQVHADLFALGDGGLACGGSIRAARLASPALRRPVPPENRSRPFLGHFSGVCRPIRPARSHGSRD